VTIDTRDPGARRFVPAQALGAALDGLQHGEVASVYTPRNIIAMQSAGFVPITYRLRTELGGEAWHWNPRGTWSDSLHEQGYWTSSADTSQSINVSYGYRLPRRGNTIDQANDDGYSRIDDGKSATFWKSNPYLELADTAPRREGTRTPLFRPQWIVVDFRKYEWIDAVRIHWGDPYATRFVVQWWESREGGASASGTSTIDPSATSEVIPGGTWRTFPKGTVDGATGGDMLLRLGSVPTRTRLIRILMTEASRSAPHGASDVRDSLGVAVHELAAGLMITGQGLRDAIHHAASHTRQTIVYASSTDPWHRASDIDPNVEQPGVDLLFKSGMTAGHPTMFPVGILYDTPDNAANALRYIRARGYRVDRIEMGEEPDGQGVAPEDYATLYLSIATALHRVDPFVALGGPSFQDAVAFVSPWPDLREDRAWMRRFLNVLRRRNRMRDFAFFSFEWYPYDELCGPTMSQLTREPVKLAAAMDTLRADGVPTDVPWIMAEYGYSAFAGQPEVELAGAILNADIVAHFLTLGGAEAYLYGYEPTSLMRNERCNSWGNNMIFEATDDPVRTPAPRRLAPYYGARLLTQAWVQPGMGLHTTFPARVAAPRDSTGGMLISAYAVQHPDSTWALLLLNKDPRRTRKVRIQFQRGGALATFRDDLDLYQYSSAQYVWHPRREQGYAAPNASPVHRRLRSGAALVALPPYSMTVLHGTIAP